MTTMSGFVPVELDTTNWSAIEPLGKALLERPVSSAGEFETWLLDRSELEAACSEGAANLYIAMTCDTDNEQAQKAWTAYLEQIEPKLKPLAFALDGRHVELADRFPLDTQRYEVLDRDTRADVALFREENVPIQTDLAKLSQQWDQISGVMTVTFDGEEKTIPQMGVYQESTDRSVRESAWRAVAERRARDADAIDELFGKMIELRDREARNAGFDDYMRYMFKVKHRFDYTPADCEAFHEACERVVVPLMRKLDEQRREGLGADELRPWDLAVDVKGRPPLSPFDGGVELVSKARATFDALDPRLGEMFSTLGDGAGGVADGDVCLDLDSRRGKAPGGYQYMRDRSRKPFIFMNAAGLHRDMETMLHEAGHAFHSMLCVDEPLLHYRHSPLEFAEVASMSMELLTMPYWDTAYYDKTDADRARRQQLEGSVMLLPWVATIDAFQHWLYTHPDHTRADREAKWLELDERFGHAVSWEGMEDLQPIVWHRQPHLFSHPFYYIEYGIAQLGALGLWVRSLEEGEPAAIEAYTTALRLGGSRPLPELFGAAGLPFDFGPETVSRLVARVETELEKLPD